MVFIVVMMAVILVLCGVIAAYVAFPHRGEELPVAPWLGDAMARAADALPVLDEEEHSEDSAFADRW
ncbi:MAG: hypothetical protein M3237_08565 [Actinomycetota bacterium]|nr:hypothetical protein [Actinomycetota bacterium]